MREGRCYLQDKTFSTLEEMIFYYGHHDVPNIEGVPGVRLRHPISDDAIVKTDSGLSQNDRPPALPPRQSSTTSAQGNLEMVRKASDSSSRGSPPFPEKYTDARHGSTACPKTSSCSESLKKQSSSSSESLVEEVFDEDPPLPVCTKQKGNKKGFLSKIKQHSQDEKKESKAPRNRLKSDPMANRPPAALPREALSYSEPGSDGYAVLEDLDVDRTNDFIEQLRLSSSSRHQASPNRSWESSSTV